MGVSKNIIRYFVLGNTLKDSKLNRIIDQSKLLLTTTQAQFFHILRGNNQDADRIDNREIYMAPSSLSIQGWVSFIAPPNGKDLIKKLGQLGPHHTKGDMQI